MKALFKFVLISNLSAAIVTTIGYWFVPIISAQKIVDLMFIIGLLFWTASTVARMGNSRLKKADTAYHLVMENPQHILGTDHLASRLLIAGIPPLAGAIVIGTIFY
jgi:hypothetical protein